MNAPHWSTDFLLPCPSPKNLTFIFALLLVNFSVKTGLWCGEWILRMTAPQTGTAEQVNRPFPHEDCGWVSFCSQCSAWRVAAFQELRVPLLQALGHKTAPLPAPGTQPGAQRASCEGCPRLKTRTGPEWWIGFGRVAMVAQGCSLGRGGERSGAWALPSQL